jgi:nucleotide-binding universal stress UspA family protein
MFKNILVATDGSALSGKAVDGAIDLAQATGAKLLALSVAEPYRFSPFSEAAASDASDLYEEKMACFAQENVERVAVAARARTIVCETLVTRSYSPYEEIINAAQRHDCDLICMSSHGRRGLKGLLLGSETQKVLTHSSIPVLVFR